MSTINKLDLLFTKLKDLVDNDDIMNILTSFINNTILWKNQVVIIESIYYSKLISEVLLNYSLFELDHYFRLVLPECAFSRFVQEIILSDTGQCSQEDLRWVFDSHYLAGKIISIEPDLSNYIMVVFLVSALMVIFNSHIKIFNKGIIQGIRCHPDHTRSGLINIRCMSSLYSDI
jgi:hypothetical protein